MHACVININNSSNNLPCYPPDNRQSHNAVYWSDLNAWWSLSRHYEIRSRFVALMTILTGTQPGYQNPSTN